MQTKYTYLEKTLVDIVVTSECMFTISLRWESMWGQNKRYEKPKLVTSFDCDFQAH